MSGRAPSSPPLPPGRRSQASSTGTGSLTDMSASTDPPGISPHRSVLRRSCWRRTTRISCGRTSRPSSCPVSTPARVTGWPSFDDDGRLRQRPRQSADASPDALARLERVDDRCAAGARAIRRLAQRDHHGREGHDARRGLRGAAVQPRGRPDPGRPGGPGAAIRHPGARPGGRCGHRDRTGALRPGRQRPSSRLRGPRPAREPRGAAGAGIRRPGRAVRHRHPRSRRRAGRLGAPGRLCPQGDDSADRRVPRPGRHGYGSRAGAGRSVGRTGRCVGGAGRR